MRSGASFDVAVEPLSDRGPFSVRSRSASSVREKRLILPLFLPPTDRDGAGSYIFKFGKKRGPL